MVRAKKGIEMTWYVQDEINQEESEHNEIDGMKKEADATGDLHCVQKKHPLTFSFISP